MSEKKNEIVIDVVTTSKGQPSGAGIVSVGTTMRARLTDEPVKLPAFSDRWMKPANGEAVKKLKAFREAQAKDAGGADVPAPELAEAQQKVAEAETTIAKAKEDTAVAEAKATDAETRAAKAKEDAEAAQDRAKAAEKELADLKAAAKKPAKGADDPGKQSS